MPAESDLDRLFCEAYHRLHGRMLDHAERFLDRDAASGSTISLEEAEEELDRKAALAIETPSRDALARAARAHGVLRDEPYVGDIFLLYSRTRGRFIHTGIVGGVVDGHRFIRWLVKPHALIGQGAL